MKIYAHSAFNNVWVPYLKKYFNTRKPEIDFDIDVNPKGINTKQMSESDVTLFCWGNEPTIEMTHKKKLSKRYVVILRSYEIFYGFINHINWKNVDDVIFVNPAFAVEFGNKLPCRVHYVPNGIDLDEWKFQEGHKESNNIGWVANLNHKKGINLLPQFLYEYKKHNDKFVLHVAGKAQEPRFMLYCDHLFNELGLTDNIKFYNHVSNIQEWWKDKDYCFTCSVTEGHPNNVIEAMSLGVKPIIHNWLGAKQTFPESLIWSNMDEALRIILLRNYDSKSYRKFIEDNYDIFKVYKQLEGVLLNGKTDIENNKK